MPTDRPSLSVCLVTQDMAHFLPHCLAGIENIADEIIAIDGASTDGTLGILERHPKVRCFERRFAGHFGQQKNYAIEQARGDWVLVVDSDEVLGDRMQELVPKLMQSKKYTHYKFARYWITDGPPYRYIRTPMHYPDFQLRLFRNLPFFRYPSEKVVHTHFPRKGRGPGRKIRRAHIFHFDFILNDRSGREAKYERYLDLEPSTAKTSQMYLYEDFEAEPRKCREAMTTAQIDCPSVRRDRCASVFSPGAGAGG